MVPQAIIPMRSSRQGMHRRTGYRGRDRRILRLGSTSLTALYPCGAKVMDEIENKQEANLCSHCFHGMVLSTVFEGGAFDHALCIYPKGQVIRFSPGRFVTTCNRFKDGAK